MSRVKIAEEIVFLFFFSEFFSDFERQIFQTFGQKTSRSCQNYFLRVQRNNLWLEIFLRFWIVSDFLQKRLAWFSNFYLCVQSKNSGRNKILFFFSEIFRILSKIFPDIGQKISRSFQNYLLRAHRNSLGPEFFLQFRTVLVFLQKTLAWFSKFYLRVQSKKSGRNSFFYSSFQIFYRFWANIFQTFETKNFKKLSKLPCACADEQFLAWKFFQKFWTVLDFLQKPLAWFSNFYLRVQGKNSGKKQFFYSSFQSFFSDFKRKIFQNFGQKTSRSCQNYLLRVQRNSFWLEIFF